MEFHEPAKLQRDHLVIERSEALLPVIDEHALPQHREWALKQVREYIDRASWQLLRYPLTRPTGTYTALDWAIFPNTDGLVLQEARDRVADLLQIVRAAQWPLVWYQTETHELTDADIEEIREHISTLRNAFEARDYAKIERLTGLGTLHANDFMPQATEVLKREEAPMFRHPDYRVSDLDWGSISFEPRFDARVVRLFPSAGKRAGGVFSIGPDTAGFDKSVVLKAVRSPSGWLLAR